VANLTTSAAADRASPQDGSRPSVLRRIPNSVVGIVIMGLITLYFTTTQSSFNLFTFNLCLLAAMGALALNLLMGTAGQVSIGNAAFLAIGAFGTVWAERAGVPFPFDILVAAGIAAMAGFLVGLPALRIQGLYLALATLAANFIVLYFADRYQTEANDAGAAGFRLDAQFSSQDLIGQQRAWAWLLLGVLCVVVLGVARLIKGRSGRAFRLIRTHETVAAAMGVPVARNKLMLFMATSAVIAVQGGLTAHLTGSVTVEGFTLLVAVSYIAMIIIGGLDSLWGGVIGAAIVISLPTFTSNFVETFTSTGTAGVRAPQIAQIIYGLLVIFFVTLSPNGIAGWPKSIRDLRGRGNKQINVTPGAGEIVEHAS
jgi:branched-chain amino acid transport system permease protein